MAFEGKTAVITGGLSGIGFATASCLLENGISVCIISKKNYKQYFKRNRV